MIETENNKRTEISSLGEFKLIEKLTKDFKSKNKSTLKAVGDDAAVIKIGDDCKVITTDMLVEGVHFDMMYTPLKHLGYKAVVVNLSDIYAMNAIPEQITVSIAVSSKFSVEALEEFYRGIALACEKYKIDLIGGDTTASLKGLTISVTAIGTAKEGDIVYRNGTKAGEVLCVSGDLGAAYLGLQLLEREKQVYMEDQNMHPELEDHEYVVERILKPEARKDVVQYFADEKIIPTSMIDISDGLSSEIMHICEQSKVGCLIDEAAIPIHPEVFEMAVQTFGLDPTVCALSGGEDYELLFTVTQEDLEKIKKYPDINPIGIITDKADEKKIKTKSGKIYDLLAQGWDGVKAISPQQ